MKPRQLIVFLSLWSFACGRETSTEETPTTHREWSDASATPTTLASKDLGQELAGAARAAHLLADRAETEQDKVRAAQALIDAFERSPHLKTTTASSIRKDLLARAARLHAEVDEFDQARSLVHTGLALGQGESIAQIELLMVLADIEEATGHEKESRRALVEALRINQVLLEKELKNP